MGNNIKLDLPSINQIVGPDRLEIFDKIGVEAQATEYANITGCYDCYATKTPYSDSDSNDEIIVCGGLQPKSIKNYRVGIRPIVQYSQILDICKNERYGENKELIVECGMYPSKIVDENRHYHQIHEKDIERLSYTIYSRDTLNGTQCNFIYKNNADGKLYSDISAWNSSVTSLPAVGGIRCANNYVAQHQPVEWFVDEKADIAIAKNIIKSGIIFNHFSPTYSSEEEFENTYMSKYLNTYLVHELFQQYPESKSKKVFKKK